MKLILPIKTQIIIIIAIPVFFFLISMLLTYLNDVVLPTKLKPKIIQELEEKLNKSAQIGRMHYNPLQGLVIQDLVIFDKHRGLYLEAKEVSFNFLILPLFRTDIIIPSVYFKDEHFIPSYTKEITNLKIGINWNLSKQINFTLQAKNFDSSFKPSSIAVAGTYFFSNHYLFARIKLNNIFIEDYLLYLKKLPFSVSSGIINADLRIDFKDQKLAVNGMTYIKHLKLSRNRFSLSGDIDIQPNIKYDLQNKKFEYHKGRMGLSDATFSGLKYLEDISNIQGDIYLEGNEIWSYGLKATILDTPIDIKGKANLFFNQLSWKNVTIAYKQIPYNCSGNMDITDFKRPKVELQLISRDLALNTNFNIKDKIINIGSCTGKYLNNEFAIKGLVDIKEKLLKLDAELGFSLKDIARFFSGNINNKFKKIKTDKDISGVLSMSLHMKADMRLLLDTLEAKGSFSIKEANLWELNLFNRLGEFLSLPMYQKITFEGGEGNFIIYSRNMYIVESHFKSKELNLSWKGKIGLNGSLDLVLDAEINKDLIKELTDSKYTLPIIYNLPQIQISGSLIKPNYKFISLNEETLDQIKQSLPLH